MTTIEPINVPSGFRQGDILRINESSERPFGCQHAIVLTADCDIAQRKHYGQIILCPLIPATIFMKTVWAERKLIRLRQSTLAKLRREFELITDGNAISDGTIETIASNNDDLVKVLSDLVKPSEQRKSITRQAQILRLCTSTDADAYENLAIAYQSRDGSQRDAALTKIHREFKDDLKGDAIDIVVVPDEIGMKASALVAVLRSPFSIEADAISDSLHGRANPIARLCAQVKYLLSQKFGALFSRIGLPQFIEDDRDVAIDLEELSNEP